VPDARRILRVAIDSLYVSFKGSLGPATRARLNDLKKLAQDKEPLQRSLAQLEIGGRVFSVLGHGRGRLPFALDDCDFSLNVGSGCVFRPIVTGWSGNVTGWSGNVTGRSGIVTGGVQEGFEGCV